MIKYFDNKGQLIQDDENIIRMEKVSTRLFSTFSLNILQEVFSTVEGRLAFRKVLKDFNSDKIYAKFKTNTKFFLIDPTISLLEKKQTLSYDISQEPYTVLGDGTFETSSQNKEAIQFWIGFESESEGEFTDTLQIYFVDDLTGDIKILKEFLFSCYAVSDDIRYKILLSNLGQSIDSQDYLAFFETNINEKLPDNIILNKKRKELIYTLPDILPFIGSYKALINAIKYFGYENVKLKEYWKNVNTNSPGFGRQKQVEIAQDIFNLDSLNDNSRSSPSIIWRKSNTFGLFFDIIVATDEEDEQDLPVTEEVFSIPISEIFAKITYLKAKLEKDFIMLNSRIIDIVAEAIYFGKVAFKVSSNFNQIKSVNVNINPTFEVEGGCEQQLINLRQLQEFGCPIGSDLQLTGESDLLHHRLDVVQLGSSFLQSRYELEITTGAGTASETVDLFQRDLYQRDIYTLEQIAELLVQEFSNSNNSIFKQHRFFVEPSSLTTIRIVQIEEIGTSVINDIYWDINTGFTTWADTSFPFGLNIDVSPGSSYFGVLGAPLSYYSDAILASFDSFQPALLPLPDSPLVPVGAPIVLRNTSFDVALEDLNITFEQLGALDTNGSFKILGFDAIDVIPPFPVSNYLGNGQTIVQPLNNFDYSDFPSESSPNLNDLAFGDFYEGEWEITQSDRNWVFNSSRLSLEDLDNYPVILPFIGNYTVKLTLYDMLGGESVLIDQSCLKVIAPNSNFISWRRAGLKDYLFTDYKKIYADSLENVFGLPSDLTIGEIFSPLEHPIPENESIDYTQISFYNFDQVEFYQDLIYKIPNDYPNIGPRHYKIENLDQVTLEDLYHVWVDMCSPSVVVNTFSEIGDSGIIYMGNYNEWDNLLKNNPNILPVTSDVLALSYTGPGNQYLVSKESDRVFFYDFSENKVQRTQWTIGVIELGDQTGLPQLDRMLNFIKAGNNSTSKWFKDNIYYLEWDYSGVSPVPYVKIISKSFEFEGKYYLSSFDTTWSYFQNYSYIDGGFPLGDIRVTFEIFSVDSTPTVTKSIKIGDAPAYLPTNTQLNLLANELNAADVEGINLFSYNTVFDEFGTPLKIIAVLKNDLNIDNIKIIYEGIIGTTFGRVLSDNPKLYDVRIDKFYDKPYPNGTLMFFVIDNSEINGKFSAIWRISKLNENEDLELRLELKSINLPFLFNEKGWWNVDCQIEDNNGNIFPSKNKKILIQ